ncbi:hypothetical protein E2542_SST20316 [Spatholobus suberectus]|nr:hypothetical protein E2542_SST20316 [Spatholobus suberectus]
MFGWNKISACVVSLFLKLQNMETNMLRENENHTAVLGAWWTSYVLSADLNQLEYRGNAFKCLFWVIVCSQQVQT